MPHSISTTLLHKSIIRNYLSMHSVIVVLFVAGALPCSATCYNNKMLVHHQRASISCDWYILFAIIKRRFSHLHQMFSFIRALARGCQAYWTLFIPHTCLQRPVFRIHIGSVLCTRDDRRDEHRTSSCLLVLVFSLEHMFDWRHWRTDADEMAHWRWWRSQVRTAQRLWKFSDVVFLLKHK